MLDNFLKTLKAFLGGLLVMLPGAVTGSVLLSFVVIAGHTLYIDRFVPDAIRDGQWETFCLMGTVPYGALLGAVATVAKVTIHYARRSDRVTASLICLSGGLLTMICSGALICLIATIETTRQERLPCSPSVSRS